MGCRPPEDCFISCTSSLRGEEVREAGGDAGGEECSVAVDGACAARRFAFCRAFFAFLLSSRSTAAAPAEIPIVSRFSTRR